MRSSLHCFTLQTAAAAKVRKGKSQEPETPSCTHLLKTATRDLDSHLLAFSSLLDGTETSTLIWAASIQRDGLIHSTTKTASILSFLIH